MFIKRLVAIGAATVALAGAGVVSAGPASATVETNRWCNPDVSMDWWVCLVEQTDSDGSKWYYGHAWTDMDQEVIVDLYDKNMNRLWRDRSWGWAATARFQQGWTACIYDEIHDRRFVCA